MDGEENELTFDEILKDPTYQAEFDKRVQKAIEKNKTTTEEAFNKKLEEALAGREEEMRKNIQEEIEAKQKEAEEMAKMSEAEKYKKLLDQQNQKMTEYEKKLALVARKERLNNYVKEKGYDLAILDLVSAETLTDANLEGEVDKVNETFSNKVSKALDDKLKEAGDTVLGNKGKDKGPSFDFGFQSIKPETK